MVAVFIVVVDMVVNGMELGDVLGFFDVELATFDCVTTLVDGKVNGMVDIIVDSVVIVVEGVVDDVMCVVVVSLVNGAPVLIDSVVACDILVDNDVIGNNAACVSFSVVDDTRLVVAIVCEVVEGVVISVVVFSNGINGVVPLVVGMVSAMVFAFVFMVDVVLVVFVIGGVGACVLTVLIL